MKITSATPGTVTLYVRTSQVNLWVVLGFLLMVFGICAITCCRMDGSHVNISNYDRRTGAQSIDSPATQAVKAVSAGLGD